MRARLVLAIATLVGCSSESRPAEQPKPTQKPKRPVVAEKVQEPVKKIDLSLGAGYEMRRPITDGRLSIIPIIATREQPAQKYITLQEGMAQGQVVVREVVTGYDDFVVDTVRIHNKAIEPLVVLSGEVILDAHQDRVTAENTVVMAGESRTLRVRCVEKERDYGGGPFNPSHALAELSLRRVVANSHQEAVWWRVDQINRREKTATGTRTYRHAAKKLGVGKHAERRDALVKQLEALEERNQIVGIVVAIDGKPVALERFASPELYRHFESKLLASYLPETEGPAPADNKLAPKAVQDLAKRKASTTAATHSILL